MKLHTNLFDNNTVENITQNFKNLKPKEPKYTTIELIQKLKPQIKETLIKGYTYKEISEMFISSGVKISESTLKNYINKTNKLKKKETKASNSNNIVN